MLIKFVITYVLLILVLTSNTDYKKRIFGGIEIHT